MVETVPVRTSRQSTLFSEKTAIDIKSTSFQVANKVYHLIFNNRRAAIMVIVARISLV